MLDALPIVVGLSLLLAALTWLYPPLLRPFLWLFVRLCYRFRVDHRERIPKTGGVLVVSNHVSYIDWLVHWIASPRPATFVLWGGYYRNPILRFFLSWARQNTLRIDNQTSHPHAIADASSRSPRPSMPAGWS